MKDTLFVIGIWLLTLTLALLWGMAYDVHAPALLLLVLAWMLLGAFIYSVKGVEYLLAEHRHTADEEGPRCSLCDRPLSGDCLAIDDTACHVACLQATREWRAH